MFLPIISAAAAASMMASRAATTTTATVLLGRIRPFSPVPSPAVRMSGDELEMRMLLRNAPQPPRQDTKAVAEPRTFDSSSWTGRAA